MLRVMKPCYSVHAVLLILKLTARKNFDRAGPIASHTCELEVHAAEITTNKFQALWPLQTPATCCYVCGSADFARCRSAERIAVSRQRGT